MATDGNYQLDVLVPAHNHLEQTMKCLIALYKHTANSFHLIVVDDSTDGLTPLYIEQLRKDHSNVTYFHSDYQFRNSYEFINIGLSECMTPYIALVVNSVQVEPGWDSAGLHLLQTTPDVGIVGCKTITMTGEIESAGILISGNGAVIRDIGAHQPSHRLSQVYEVPATAFALIIAKVEALQGTMDSCPYNGFKGWEEFDTCFQVRQNGWKILYCGLGVGYHQPYSTRDDKSSEGQRLNAENREILAKRWGMWEAYHKAYSHIGELRPDIQVREISLPQIPTSEIKEN
ncbi:MAG: glycosyltransferase [Sphaerochaeta sp.]|jgi:GT2 family glycosyltransferase|nr:glycosyltransferase [Sphaerochaeta sp.]